MTPAFFPYALQRRYAPVWVLLGAREGRDGVTIDDETLRATFGRHALVTDRGNVAGGHITEDYRWFKVVGIRLSAADTGLTFGTNAQRGVCIHFGEPVPAVIGPRPHAALTVTVADCEGLIEVIGHA